MTRYRGALALLLLVLLLSSTVVSANTLEVWIKDFTPETKELFEKEIIPRFEAAHPGVKVNVQFLGEAILQKLTTAFAAGNPPDLFHHGTALVPEFAVAGTCQALDRFIEREPDYLADFFESSLAAGQYQGKTYAIPQTVLSQLLVYRASMFEEVGLDPNAPPRTWDELRDAARKLTIWDGDLLERAGFAVPTSGVDTVFFYTLVLRSLGGSLVAEDGETPAFNNEVGREALQIYVDLIQKDRVTMLGSITPAPGGPMVTGEAAMVIDTPHILANIRAYAPQIESDIRVAPAPSRDGTTPASILWGVSFYVPTAAKNPDLAWEMIKLLTSPEYNLRNAQSLGAMPSLKSLITSGYVQDDPLMRQWFEAVEWSRANPGYPAYREVRNKMAEHLEMALHGRQTPEAVLEAAAAEAQMIVDSWKSR